jgi:hypothetical protein
VVGFRRLGPAGYPLTGLLYENGAFSYFDPPNSATTEAIAINDSGLIGGTFVDNSAGGVARGFLYDPNTGQYTVVHVPGSSYTNITTINNNNLAAGLYFDSSGNSGSYIYQNGNYTTFNVPTGLGFSGGAQPTPTSMNSNGEVIGNYYSANGQYRGYTYFNGVFQTISVPGSAQTLPTGINAFGEIVGSYDFNGGTGGFLLQPDGTYTLFEATNSTYTIPLALNDTGIIVGWTQRPVQGGGNEGFIATYSDLNLPSSVPEPATTFVFLFGLCTLLLLRPNAASFEKSRGLDADNHDGDRQLHSA